MVAKNIRLPQYCTYCTYSSNFRSRSCLRGFFYIWGNTYNSLIFCFLITVACSIKASTFVGCTCVDSPGKAWCAITFRHGPANRYIWHFCDEDTACSKITKAVHIEPRSRVFMFQLFNLGTCDVSQLSNINALPLNPNITYHSNMKVRQVSGSGFVLLVVTHYCRIRQLDHISYSIDTNMLILAQFTALTYFQRKKLLKCRA